MEALQEWNAKANLKSCILDSSSLCLGDILVFSRLYLQLKIHIQHLILQIRTTWGRSKQQWCVYCHKYWTVFTVAWRFKSHMKPTLNSVIRVTFCRIILHQIRTRPLSCQPAAWRCPVHAALLWEAEDDTNTKIKSDETRRVLAVMCEEEFVVCTLLLWCLMFSLLLRWMTLMLYRAPTSRRAPAIPMPTGANIPDT